MEYLLSFLIGITLGVFGGGGTILMTPMLVYLSGVSEKKSIAMSLGIIFIVAMVGLFQKRKLILFDWAFRFLFFSTMGTVLGSRISIYFPGVIQMIILGVLILMASFLMIFKKKKRVKKYSKKSFSLKAFFIGILTGVVGVGGGFLIVPLLVFSANLPMKNSVATSLFVIMLNSLIGFVSYSFIVNVNHLQILQISFFSCLGILVGNLIGENLPQEKLKKSFGVFLFFVGGFILYKNFITL